MTQGILIVFCLLAGVLLRRASVLPPGSHRSVNGWIIYVAMPAFALHYVPGIQWDIVLFMPFVMPVVLVLGAWILSLFLARRYSLSRTTRTALLLATGWGNTAFVGYPLTEAYFGEEGLKIAILCDQMTFVMLSTVGISFAILATEKASGKAIIHTVLRRMFRFPPFLGFLSALMLPELVDLDPIIPVLERLSGTLIPLALFSIGLQLEFSGWKIHQAVLGWGLLYKLLIAPALVLLVALSFGQTGLNAQISVFEAAMAPMVTSAIIAEEYKLDAKLCGLLIGIGLPLSFLTTMLWWLGLSWMG